MRECLLFCDQDTLEATYLREFISEGRVPQNLFYLLNGATVFYSYRNEDIEQIAWEDEVRFFSEQGICGPGDRVAFVSLGCGNAGPEKMLLRKLAADGCDLHYVGVDSSAGMLDLATENLDGESYRQSFVLADFSAPDFGERLDAVIAGADTRVYAMIGGTFGNFDQDFIADLLASLTPKGSHFYLDVVPTEPTEGRNEELEHRLSHLPQNLGDFFDRLLGALGLSREVGEVIRQDRTDGDLRTMRFTFAFRVTQCVHLACLGMERVLNPGEVVELFTVRAYDPESLVTFLGRRGFSLVDTYEPDVGGLSHRWQRLLLEKNGVGPQT